MSQIDGLVVEAPAKINLYLQVLGKRPDGYHEIHSLLQAISLTDTIRLIRRGSGIRLNCVPAVVPSDDTNLAWRAAALFCDTFCPGVGVEIEVQKRIPVGAGLGGGSSDAAATLLGLNHLFGLRVPREKLMKLAAKLGSDVPFFLTAGTAVAEGRGEILQEFSLPLDFQVFLVTPDFEISTAEAYSALRISLTSFSIKSTISTGNTGVDIWQSIARIGNDFTRFVVSVYPVVGECMRLLQDAGARYVGLSGSGSAFYGIYGQPPDPTLADAVSGRFGWTTYSLLPIRLPT